MFDWFLGADGEAQLQNDGLTVGRTTTDLFGNRHVWANDGRKLATARKDALGQTVVLDQMERPVATLRPQGPSTTAIYDPNNTFTGTVSGNHQGGVTFRAASGMEVGRTRRAWHGGQTWKT